MEGFFTNHSLRSSCATILYNDPANIPEQAIAERTGHRSLAIRSYKRTQHELKRKVSDILTGYAGGYCEESEENKAPKLDVDSNLSTGSVKDLVTTQNVKLDICVSLKK